MPSFDIVSKVDNHELNNAVDQANREVTTRFDFKDTGASFELADDKGATKIVMKAPSDFQVQQMHDILQSKVVKRDIDIKAFEYGEIEASLHEARQTINVKQGISTENGKKIVKQIKNSKLKVQASIQGDQVRVTGKKRDDLQDTMAALKEAEMDFPLQFTNFRD